MYSGLVEQFNAKLKLPYTQGVAFSPLKHYCSNATFKLFKALWILFLTS